MTNPYRDLPAVHQLLAALDDVTASHAAKVAACRAALERARDGLQTSQAVPDLATLIAWIQEHLQRRAQLSLRPVINATGVIVHTNLGRAPLSDETLAAMQAVAGGYSNLEYDLAEGRRGQRDIHTDDLLRELTGAEASLVVNNNAAAVYLVLNVFAQNREIIISRGQLVEIGGGFRIPDVMQQGGAILIEVGTTNRTRGADFEAAITPQTVALMRVHSSNFKQIGFVQDVPLAEMAAIAHRHDLIVIDDLGSGTLLDTTRFGLAPEPTIKASIDAGADVVLFSGDKLLGGPQAGIILGKQALINQIRQHPLMRAMRPDKTTLVGMARTLQHYRDDEAIEKIPVWQMIAMSLSDIKSRAVAWQAMVGGDVVEATSMVGGGSLPGDSLPTWALKIAASQPDQIAGRLRQHDIPVICRIQDGALLFDPRTVFLSQDGALLGAIQSTMEG